MAQTDIKPALLDPADLAELGPPEAVRLPTELIDPSPANPRDQLPEIPELAANIRQFGLLQPVTVRRQDARYELIGGHRRRLAFLMLAEQFPFEPQWRSIPSVIKTADDATANLMLISAQVHSRAWRPREEAAILEELVSSRTLKEVGVIINKSEEWVGRRLKVYADSTLSGFVQSGRLPASIAEELLAIKDLAIRRELAERATLEQWSQSQARAEVRRLRLDAQIREIGRQARTLLETLSAIDATRLPSEMASDLWKLQRRIVALGRGAVIPSIAEAERAAGVNPNAKPRRAKKRRRAMPPPG